MFNFFLAASVLITLFIILFVSVIVGRKFGEKQIAQHIESQLEVVIVAEGAVFTLLALLVAFAFSGAYERFENRKLHIIEEANVINIAYKRISMLAPETQLALRQSFREYLDAQLYFYRTSAKVNLFNQELAASLDIENKIWKEALAAMKVTNDQTVTSLFTTAISDMFNSETTGMETSKIHPPLAIFILLIGLAILSGFLAGYSTAELHTQNSMHILSYVAITAFTIYIIIDLEFPRNGLIRVDAFDQFLINVRNNMTDNP